MARHDQVAHLFADGVFFAYPGRPWERGSNENTNGLLRQYFPKRSDLRVYSPAELAAIEDRLNNRPRKDPRLVDSSSGLCRGTTVLMTVVLRRRFESTVEPTCRRGASFRPPLTAVSQRKPVTCGFGPFPLQSRGFPPNRPPNRLAE